MLAFQVCFTQAHQEQLSPHISSSDQGGIPPKMFHYSLAQVPQLKVQSIIQLQQATIPGYSLSHQLCLFPFRKRHKAQTQKVSGNRAKSPLLSLRIAFLYFPSLNEFLSPWNSYGNYYLYNLSFQPPLGIIQCPASLLKVTAFRTTVHLRALLDQNKTLLHRSLCNPSSAPHLYDQEKANLHSFLLVYIY